MKRETKKKVEIKIYSTSIIAILAISPFVISKLSYNKNGKEISMRKVLDKNIDSINSEKMERLVGKSDDIKIKNDVLNNFAKCDELDKVFESQLESLSLTDKTLEENTDFIDGEKIELLVGESDDTKIKNDILNNFTKCDTLEKIYERQSQLESLSLINEDKIYKDCPLSAELQRFIYEQSTMNNIPFDFLISIIHVESRGNFNSSGQVGYNSATSHDLGLTQQNTISSLPNFMKIYDVSYEDGYQLLKDNDYANVCASLLVCDEISKQFDEYNPYEFAGCYNGWLNWRNYSVSREYVAMFQEAYDEIYTDYHDVKEVNSSNTNYQKKNK